MITLGGYNFELGTIKKEPKFGYIDEYREYVMLSGKLRRDVKGKRFTASFAYQYLTNTEISNLMTLIANQKTAGYISAEISVPGGTYTGNVFLTIDDTQIRFGLEAGVPVWYSWTITVVGVDLE